MVIYSRRLLPAWAIGRAIGPVIVIDPAQRADAGLLAHERQHVRQWAAWLLLVWAAVALYAWQSPVLGLVEWFIVGAGTSLGIGAHHLAYWLLPEYRLWAELRAYREQARHYPGADRLPLFAAFIALYYDLAISDAAALSLLRES